MSRPATQHKRAAYPSYKPSGLGWLEDVPSMWSVTRLRFQVKINPVKSEIRGIPEDTSVSFVPMEAVGEYGGLRLEQTQALGDVANGYTYFRDGDVVVAKITPCFENGKGSIADGLENGIGFGTTELHVLRPSSFMGRNYLFYLTISHAFRKIGASYMYGAGGQKRVPNDFIRDFRHPIPAVDEQHTIATFLDRETARIDALIEKKRRQIVLLQEKRSALISHTVTKGLDLNAPMKDSGIEWLGDVPEHWDFRRLKYTASINDEALTETTDPDYEFVYVDIGSVDAAKGIVATETYRFEDAPSRARRIVRDGDTIVSTVRTYLRAIAPIRDPDDNMIVSTGFAVVRPRKLDSGYLSYALRSPFFVETVVSRSTGVSYPAINAPEVGNIGVTIPTLDEQRSIAAFLDREKVEKSIETLREYRTALISAAVTGKIDVRKEVS